jgi:hypothetical protein
MFATDRVPLGIVVVAQAQELIKDKSKRRKNAYVLPEGNVSLGEVADVFNRFHVKDGFDGQDTVFLRPNAFPPTFLNPDTLVRKFMYLMEDASHRSWKNGVKIWWSRGQFLNPFSKVFLANQTAWNVQQIFG